MTGENQAADRTEADTLAMKFVAGQSNSSENRALVFAHPGLDNAITAGTCANRVNTIRGSVRALRSQNALMMGLNSINTGSMVEVQSFSVVQNFTGQYVGQR